VSGWRFAGSCIDSEPFLLDERQVWAERWHDTGESADVIDPIYGQPHVFGVWTIGTPPLRFAAGEFSNQVWGFYLPE
jgi:hypothetical protein